MSKEFYQQQIKLEHNMLNYLVKKNKFSQKPILLADVGARFGFDTTWQVFENQCISVGFEPDKEEYYRLKEIYSEDRTKILEDVALWDKEGFQTLYVLLRQSASSCLKPKTSFFKRLPDSSPMNIIKTLQIPTTTLDLYCAKNNINFNVLKLDVQGGELNVLKGGVDQLEQTVLAVIIEVEFVELYKNQPLFAEVDIFMRAHGFSLFDLDIRKWRRKALPKVPKDAQIGQVISSNSLYLKDPIETGKSFNKKRINNLDLLKLACLAELFSLPDYAIELVNYGEKNGKLEKEKTKQLIDLLESDKIIDA